MLRNKVRIIGGCWRGRKLAFPSEPGLRPTADRIRETLFNWLSPNLPGSRCLDLFAGSGALGFEAASRGATDVLLVDNSPPIIQQLQANKKLLKAETIHIIQASIPAPLPRQPKPFDIVFLDPPFQKQLISTACHWLVTNHYLAKGALIYIETEAELATPPIPTDWEIIRAKQAGQVKYYLVKSSSDAIAHQDKQAINALALSPKN